MKLSIIIPVYCVEDTLSRCIESVLSQTGCDYELILVNDGSPDTSPEICERYARQDSRIRVIHKQNGGLSDARNAGIDVAQGEYITFIDSDDYITPFTYQTLLGILTEHPEYDMIEYPVCVHKGSPRQHILTFTPKVYSDMYQYWLETQAYRHTYVWNKIYSRRLFQNIRYPIGKKFEDVWVYPTILQQVKLLATTDKGMYVYTYNHTGITSHSESSGLEELFEAHLATLDTQKVDRAYYAYLLNLQLYVYEHTGKEPILPVLPYWGTPKLTLLQLFGLKRTCQINKLLRWITGRN